MDANETTTLSASKEDRKLRRAAVLSPEVVQAFDVLRTSMIEANEEALAFLADLQTPKTRGELIASFIKFYPIENKGTALFAKFFDVLMKVDGGQTIDDIWDAVVSDQRGRPN